MEIKELNDHLEVIETLIEEAKKRGPDDTELSNKKEQFRAINRSIAQLKRKKIPISQEIEELREALQRDVNKLQYPKNEVDASYNRMLTLVVELGKLCRRSPRSDLSIMAKEKRPKPIAINTPSIEKAKDIIEYATAEKYDNEPPTDGILDNTRMLIAKYPEGIDIPKLKQLTGLRKRQLSNALYKLTKKGTIQTIGRGVYKSNVSGLSSEN